MSGQSSRGVEWRELCVRRRERERLQGGIHGARVCGACTHGRRDGSRARLASVRRVAALDEAHVPVADVQRAEERAGGVAEVVLLDAAVGGVDDEADAPRQLLDEGYDGAHGHALVRLLDARRLLRWRVPHIFHRPAICQCGLGDDAAERARNAPADGELAGVGEHL